MLRLSLIILSIPLAIAAFPSDIYSQIEEQCPHLNPIISQRSRIDARLTIREQLIKLCIKENKEDFERLMKRSEEIAALSTEIRTSFEESKILSNDDQKKLVRVQYLAKKVRKELRVSDDDEEGDSPESLVDAVNKLHETSSMLLSEIKKAGRHSISLVAVKSSNAVMKVVKFLRLGQ